MPELISKGHCGWQIFGQVGTSSLEGKTSSRLACEEGPFYRRIPSEFESPSAGSATMTLGNRQGNKAVLSDPDFARFNLTAILLDL